MNVKILRTLVARRKAVTTELDGIKYQVQEHKQAVAALYAQGRPLVDEAESISNELNIELGLIDQPSAPQQAV